MRKALLALPLLALTTASFGQARLVINNDAWVVIDGSSWLVIENPAANAITTAGTGGNISSEAENDRIRWQIGSTVAPYIIPWSTPTGCPSAGCGVKMPLTYNKTSAGVASATSSVVFSTYRYNVAAPNQWDNFLYKPSDVTHMNNFTTGTTLTPGATNESGHVVDRFWIMDPGVAGYAYTGKPNITLSFVYERAEVTPQTITANSPLFPQRFNSGTNRWGDFLPSGGAFAVNMPTATQNSVTNYPIPAAQYFRSFTLSDVNDPLPIELTDFKVECSNNKVYVTWTTATETDNAYFTVQRSQDGVEWLDLGQVAGSGTTTVSHNYTYVDVAPVGLAYYRLIQTDTDGDWSSSNGVPGGCGTSDGLEIVNVYDANDGFVTILVSSTYATQFDVSLVDASGKVLGIRNSQAINEGITQLTIEKGTIASGVYVVRLNNKDQVLTERVFLH